MFKTYVWPETHSTLGENMVALLEGDYIRIDCSREFTVLTFDLKIIQSTERIKMKSSTKLRKWVSNIYR